MLCNFNTCNKLNNHDSIIHHKLYLHSFSKNNVNRGNDSAIFAAWPEIHLEPCFALQALANRTERHLVE
jgi:hypothetical protein